MHLYACIIYMKGAELHLQWRSTVSVLARSCSQQLYPVTCLKSRRNWNNDDTGLVHALPLWPYWSAAYAARLGEGALIISPPLWMIKILLNIGLVNLQGKLNSKPGSRIWTHLVLKDSRVFIWASSSICFGGSCQTPEGCVGRCCCFLLIAMSK